MASGRARSLRKQQTDAERRLWLALRGRRLADFKFRRQVAVGPYVADFVCFEQRLIVEVDGGHHVEQQAYDDARDQWLHGQNFRVLRFTDRDVLVATESVEQALWLALTAEPLTPTLSRKGRGGQKRSMRRGNEPQLGES